MARVKQGDEQVLEEVLLSIDTELIKLRRDRATALALVPTDLKQAARVQEIDDKVAELNARRAIVRDALQARDDADIAAAKQQALEDSAADRASVIRLAEERRDVARTIDQTFDALERSLAQYSALGNTAAVLAMRAVGQLYGDDSIRLHDRMVTVLPRAQGTSQQFSIALAHRIKALLDLTTAELGGRVEVSPYLEAGPKLVEAAARLDASVLADQFA